MIISAAIAQGDALAFIAAQDELRANFGAAVTMQTPNEPIWPDGTRINPDTQQPYNAMIVPTNPAYSETVIKALVIVKAGSAFRPQGDEHFTQVGIMSGMDAILDVSSADYARVEDASDFIVMGDRFTVAEWKPFELAGITYRYLLYGQAEKTRGGNDG